jgi:HlyD family secretion protein
MKNILWIIPLLLISCRSEESDFDASGTFEAKEVIVSSENTGKLLVLTAVEGEYMEANAIAAHIDSNQLVLKKQQLQAQIQAILSRQPDENAQLAAIQEQIRTAGFEKIRLQNLVAGGAATQKQLDDVVAQLSVLEKQLDAQRSSLEKTSNSLYADVLPLSIQIAQIDDQLNKCQVLNPVKGTVLTTYAEQGEMTMAGKPIYKIADLEHMQLRAYISGDQLPGLTLGQQVEVRTDAGNGEFKTHTGTIQWIAAEAEFTPKTIQTKDERAHLVYAIRIAVPNDGTLKIGMYGEVNW